MIRAMRKVFRILMGESRYEVPPKAEAPKKRELICVLCGADWKNSVNRCKNCQGFCSWGREKGGEPSSWRIGPDGRWTPRCPAERP